MTRGCDKFVDGDLKQNGVHMAEVSREKMKQYHWFHRYVNADGREKVEPSSTFSKTFAIATCGYVRITSALVSSKANKLL